MAIRADDDNADNGKNHDDHRYGKESPKCEFFTDAESYFPEQIDGDKDNWTAVSAVIRLERTRSGVLKASVTTSSII